MSFLCLYNSTRPVDHVLISHASLLQIVPRVVITDDAVWADVRGLPVRATVERVIQALAERGNGTLRVGVAATAIAAEVAARYAPEMVTYVEYGRDREFLSPFLVSVLQPDPVLANLLDGAGVERCGDLARLSRESIEVRFGKTCVPLWKLAHADDVRRIFTQMPRTMPEASLEWSDYTVRRAERLLFIISSLCQNVCQTLQSRGEGAVVLTLRFSLVNRTLYEHTLRAARPTASHTAWMRLVRLALETMVLPDGVIGVTVAVDAIAGLGDKQGDVFDRGFTTERVAEETLAQLLDDQGTVVVEPENTAHPLVDRRTTWVSLTAGRILETRHDTSDVGAIDTSQQPALTLQLLPAPMQIRVTTITRRECLIPHRYRDESGLHTIVDAAGPDRVDGGRWDRVYAREYFRCVTDQGVLVWMYHDLRTDAWYLHGWWD